MADDRSTVHWACLASALAGRPVAVAELRAGEPSWTDGQTIYVDGSAPVRARLSAISRAGVADCRRQPGGRGGAPSGPPSAAGQALSGDRRAPGTGQQRGPAAEHAGLGRRPRHRGSQPVARGFAEPRDRAGGDRRPGARVRRDPGGQGAGRVLPRGRTARRGEPGARPARRRRAGTRGTGRCRGRRFRRSRPVHQPGRRGRLHRQVAEEDAVISAKDRQRRRAAGRG